MMSMQGTPVTIPANGLDLPAMSYVPAASGAHPAVILAPGGVQGGMFEIMEWIASRLVHAGFFAVTLSWRASSPIDDPLDVCAATDWLQSQPQVDGTRIGIMGMSRGGMSTLRSAALDPRLRAVVAFGPVTDLLQTVRGVATYAPGRYRMLVEWLGGEPDERREFYETVQAITYADRIKQPVLFVHGAHDMHCPPEQSIWMARELERFGNRQVRLEIVPGMGHYGDAIPNTYIFDKLAAMIIPFFEHHLCR
jgi:dipeptidyl aminopeptidase/acylaminoacyl peptidase